MPTPPLWSAPVWHLLRHTPHARAAGADGQQLGFPHTVFPHRKHLLPRPIRFGTPRRLPILPDLALAPYHHLLHSDDAGRTFAPPDLRPPAARHLFRRPQFRRQLPVMLLRCLERPPPTAVLFVGEERGMDFAPALQPHKKTVVMLFRLVNPADARRARRCVHSSVRTITSFRRRNDGVHGGSK